MRIVFLCNSFWPNIGGAEFVCKDIVDTLSQQHDVTVITQPANDRANSQYNMIELTAVTSYSIMKELPNAFEKIQPDLFIAFGYGKFFSDFTGKYAKDHGKPFIFMPCGDFHTNKSDLKKVLYGNFFGWVPFRNAVKIITATEWEKQHWIKKYNLNESKFKVIPYNLPKGFSNYKYEDYNPIGSKKFYLYIGRAGPNKKIAELIKAYNNSNSKYQLFIAGKGTDSDELKRIAGYGVHFFGTVSDVYKKHLIKNARAVIFPSDYESFGMCILEANVFNTPVLASNIPPFRELLSTEEIFFDNSIIEISKIFKKYENKSIPFKKLKLPNFEKELLSVVNFYENSNVL